MRRCKHDSIRVRRALIIMAAADPPLPRLVLGPAQALRPTAGHLPPHPRHPHFHGCYSLADDTLWGATRLRKGADHTLAALKTIRAARPDGAPIYVILGHPDILAAQRRERARIRSGKGLRFVGRPLTTAA